MFTDGNVWYIGKGPKDRMYDSMRERVGGKDNVTEGIHIDYKDDKIGLMVEAELMRRKNAVEDTNFKNSINSPGEKLLKEAENKDDKTQYNDIIDKANDFEQKFKQQKNSIKCY